MPRLALSPQSLLGIITTHRLKLAGHYPNCTRQRPLSTGSGHGRPVDTRGNQGSDHLLIARLRHKSPNVLRNDRTHIINFLQRFY